MIYLIINATAPFFQILNSFAIKIVAIASKILQIKIELPPARPVKNPPITAPIMKKVIIP